MSHHCTSPVTAMMTRDDLDHTLIKWSLLQYSLLVTNDDWWCCRTEVVKEGSQLSVEMEMMSEDAVRELNAESKNDVSNHSVKLDIVVISHCQCWDMTFGCRSRYTTGPIDIWVLSCHCKGNIVSQTEKPFRWASEGSVILTPNLGLNDFWPNFLDWFTAKIILILCQSRWNWTVYLITDRLLQWILCI